MTKSDLIAAVAARAPNITRITAENMVTLIFKTMTDALVRGERIELRGFASFGMKTYPGYTGRNPRTSGSIEVKPKRLPVFRVSKEMRERLGMKGESR